MIINTHSFNIVLAEKFGVNESIIITSIGYWCDHNKKNNRNLNDGRYWTYNTVDAWADMFPYYSSGQVRRLLDKLVKNGHVIKGNFNDKKYDRTAWYSLSDAICRICQMDLSNSSNAFVEISNTIPVLNTVQTQEEKVLLNSNTQNRAEQFDFKKHVTDEWYTEAKRIKPEWTDLFIQETMAIFSDYWLGEGKPKKNWLATWRNWVRKSYNKPQQQKTYNNQKLSASQMDWDKI